MKISRSKFALTLTVSGALSVGITGAIAADAVEVNNAQWGFRTSYPAAWVVQQGTAGPIYVSAAPPAPETLVRCNTTAEKVESSSVYRQSQINEGMKQSVGEEFWRAQVFGRFQDVKVESHASRLHASGVQVQEAVVSYTDMVQGKPEKGRTSSTIFVTPGATYSISCNAQVAKYAKNKNEFAAIVNSFRLTDANTVNVLPPAAPETTKVAFETVIQSTGIAAGVTLGTE